MSHPPARAAGSAVRTMLEARTVAVVGASPRPGTLGERLLLELDRSPSHPELYLVNPRYGSIGDLVCYPTLADVPGPVDLVTLAVGDASLEPLMQQAAERGDAAAVIFGSAFETGAPARRDRIRATAERAGMAVCGAGCMGFVNQVNGLRAIGYLEPDPLPSGPIALVTHSGSAFSALLRADRRLGWSLAVSSGQELVTTTADYLDYALEQPETEIVALVIETLRQADHLRATLARAAHADIPVVALAVGSSPGGRALVAAHSGALAGDDATWEALCEATGLLRVRDLAEMTDTLELLAAGRRPARRNGAVGRLATIHDSGAERVLAADVAHRLGVPFAALSPATTDRIDAVLDDGLQAANPLDVWGRGASTRELFAECLLALADDPKVGAVGLCVDLVHEYDGDTAYQEALVDAWGRTAVPLCLISNLPSAMDRSAARFLRDRGIPVLEGTVSGLAALGHLLARAARPAPAGAPAPAIRPDRRDRWRRRLAAGPLGPTDGLALVADYDLAVPTAIAAADPASVLAAGTAIGFPVALKTGRVDIAHKTEVGGVALGLADPAALRAAYDHMAAALGSEVVVMAMAEPGPELALGIVRDPLLGPLVVVASGGVLAELVHDRAVALAPVDDLAARRLIERLDAADLLRGYRGAPPADLDAAVRAVVGISTLAVELGDLIEALDVNPLRVGRRGATALDVLVEPRHGSLEESPVQRPDQNSE